MVDTTDLFNESTMVLIGAVISLAASAISFWVRQSREAAELARSRKEAGTVSFREKMEKLTASLSSASSEVDKILEEIQGVSQQREESLRNLEAKLTEFASREQQLKNRIETLEKIPLPAIEYFLHETERSERRSAIRDYILFGAGVIVSAIVSIILRLIFNV